MLEADGIGKSYGGVTALADARITVRPGAVHALLGENGAGKSTLVKILAGAVRPDAGVVRLDGTPVSFSTTADAARNGVAVVSQELNLFPDLTVLANLFPMREPRRGGVIVDRRAMAARAAPVLEELGVRVGLREPLGSLSLAERQLIEVGKALLTNPRVLILDEPTSALEQASTQRLLEIVRVLRERKVGVLLVSHILEDVMAVSDEVTVLRDGRLAMSARPRSELTVQDIVAAMLGEGRGRTGAAAAERLEAGVREELSQTAEPRGELVLEEVEVPDRLHDVTLRTRGGEVVGLAGLAGAGHHTVLEVVAGLRRVTHGRVVLPGGRAAPRGLRAAIRAGVALVSGDRRRVGLMLDKPLWENIGQVRAIAMARDGHIVRARPLRARARELVERLRIRADSVNLRAGQLSGGNQQKVVFAKWLDARPTVLLLDDPTRGVDVGAKAEMHVLIRSAAEAGATVLICSSDADELASLCDRVVVLYRGQVCAELAGDDRDQHKILEAMNTGAAPAMAA